MSEKTAARQSDDYFRDAFDFAPIGMALVGLDGLHLKINPAACRLLGQNEQELLQRSHWELTHHADQDAERSALEQVLSGHTTTAQFEKRYHLPTGTHVWTLTSVSVIRKEARPLYYLYQIHDLTQRKESELHLARLAHYDPLTGLVNRARLWEDAEVRIKSARRRKSRLAVMFIDLDHFKQINDTMGHDAGDTLLQEVARRLKSAVRESDCVARLGGDEFVMVLPDVESADYAAVVANKVRSQFAAPVVLGDQDILIGVSIGVSMFPEDGDDARSLLKCADSALYEAKAQGRNNVQFYRSEITQRVEQRMRMHQDLRRALEHQQFELYYQPIPPLGKGHGNDLWVESLIRWHHPQHGLLMPADFIAQAEESGLIVPIGEWVLQTACREAASWATLQGVPTGVTVNMAPRQFRCDNLVQVVEQALDDSGLPPASLCIEVTEHLLLQDAERNVQLIEALRQLGMQIAIDDFGVGYSSLSFMQRIRPSRVKIDRSFINGIGDDANATNIVRATVAMAQSLGITVAAEGVETQKQLDFLRAEGCDVAQGYLFSHPKPAKEFRAWLSGSPKAAAR